MQLWLFGFVKVHAFLCVASTLKIKCTADSRGSLIGFHHRCGFSGRIDTIGLRYCRQMSKRFTAVYSVYVFYCKPYTPPENVESGQLQPKL